MTEYSSDSIKIKNKYIMFKINPDKNKISTFVKVDSKDELNQKTKGKIVKNTNEFVLLTLEKTKWNPNTKIPVNMLGGPIKVLFSFYSVSKKSTIKKNKNDPRAIQFLFYTYDYYLKKKIKIDDLKNITLLAYQNKLEKRALAPKLITQIIKK